MLALTGCDKVFGLDGVPATPADAAPDASMDGSWREVTAGVSHTCAIRMDDTLWCWGRNDAGQLGLGSAARESDQPAQVPGTWKHVSSLFMTTCAIDSTDAMYCWGLSDNGQAGSNVARVLAPNLIDGETWSEVATGYYFSCGITTDGAAKCWGYNVNGELGTGDTTPSLTPRPIDSQLQFAHFDAGASQSCAIAKPDGSLWCWGFGAYGQLGQGDGAGHTSPVQVGSDAWLDVSLGNYVSCGVLATGHLRCWGTGYRSELGTAGAVSQPTPGIVGVDSDGWVDVEMNLEHACARRTDGSVWCWGENDDLQLANSNLPVTDPVPTVVPGGPTSWIAMATGQYHFCGIGADHALYCMGLRDEGALGDSTGSLTAPVQVMPAATQLAAAYHSSCAVDASNARFCWGENDHGQLGDGTARNYDVPTHMGSGGSQLVVGLYDTCVLGATGHLLCAGASPEYEIDPTQGQHLTPIEVAAGFAPFSTVTLTSHGCAIATGQLVCWGYGVDGELGDGTNLSSSNPEAIGVDKTWTQVVAGDNHTCGISANGVQCWGLGGYGELGDGTATAHTTPSPVTTTATTGTILAAGATSCLLTGGTLSCWGYNDNGQLGTGMVGVNTSPMPVMGAYREVALGREHTCAIAADRSLWCWGKNVYGGLGDGTLTDTPLPEQVSTGSWAHVTVGDSYSCGIQSDGSAWCWGADQLGQAGVPRLRPSFARLP